MSARTQIIEKLKKQSIRKVEMPDFPLHITDHSDVVSTFTEVATMVGAQVVALEEDQDINLLLFQLYPSMKNIASDLYDLPVVTIRPEQLDDPHLLNEVEVGIVEGKIGIAENGAIWLSPQIKHRALFFIAEYLIILLDKKQIVGTMQEAYEKIQFYEYDYGVFISGPSKTADIEQALVMGAHGAKGVTIILK